LLSSSLVALPVLATCSAYLLGEQLQAVNSSWPDAARSKALRAAAASSILIGAGISFTGAPPIQLLYWASIAGGLGTPVGVVLLLLVARNRNAMGSTRVGWPLVALGWLTAALITIVSVVFVWQQATPLLAALTGHGRG
jgi:Mn2+/Fe2+ NRAMP family transporter